jgi:hypothetical protein
LVKVTLEGLSIGSRDDVSFSVEKLVLSPVVRDLLRKRITIESVSVEGFRCAVVRDREGKVIAPVVGFPPTEGSTPAGKRQDAPDEGAENQTAENGVSDGAKGFLTEQPDVLVKRVDVADGRIEWIDQSLNPGSKVSIIVGGVKGSIVESSSAGEHEFSFAASMGADGNQSVSLSLQGAVSLAPGKPSLPKSARASFRADALDVNIFHAYLSHAAGRAQLPGKLAVQADFAWQKAPDRVIKFKTFVRDHQAPGLELAAEGEVGLTELLSDVRRFSFRAWSDCLPVGSFAVGIPKDFPLAMDRGAAKFRIEGRKSESEDIRLEGAATLEEVAARGYLKAVGDKLSMKAEFKFTPAELVVSNVQVSSKQRLIRAHARVSGLLEAKPVVDVSGDLIIDPRWAAAHGAGFPPGLKIEGSVPVRFVVKGKLDALHFDVAGDFTGTSIGYAAVLEKTGTGKALIASRGLISIDLRQGPPAVKASASASIDVPGIRLRVGPEGPWLDEVSFRQEAVVSFNNGAADIRESKSVVRWGTKGPEILTATATASGLGLAGAKIKGQASARLDDRLAAIGGLDRIPELKIKGNAVAKIDFSGNMSKIKWSMDCPLVDLDMALGKIWRKPSGVRAGVKADGRLSQEGLDLRKAVLDIPGLPAEARGRLVNPDGSPGQLIVEVERGELGALTQHAAEASRLGVSGPFAFNARLEHTPKGLAPVGEIRVLDVRYRPLNSPWTAEETRGVIDFAGESLTIRELSGRMTGVVEGRWEVKGAFEDISSPAKMRGNLTMRMGKGKVKADRMVRVLTKFHSKIGDFLKPKPVGMHGDFLHMNAVSAEFQLSSSLLKTDNFRMKGPGVSVGAVGELNVESLDLDLFMGIYTLVTGSETLGQYGAIRQFMEDHRDLLQIPVTSYCKIAGSAAETVGIIPCNREALERRVADRLDYLISLQDSM